ncbi:hypothetical protein G6F57_009738 [Rhizopus arrhizus]|uniref:Globin domain-containing protein n=1 Tax=Rhizopus oryzae TaxID=64495 RepID=A0A9P7BP54_RHIOR|nr:hypothetical protein G6F23_007323 [Rhizopus arrhizus]KAG1407990.1 hypothetical protein G6F58_009560 [Rhizopus delemar]KAG0762739.1 hypothetical protein G6F24_006567 [Rhizopus arrhizus]KAG0783732.1 hypothetical protein G6F21_010356 [Rhizopus arrhizus]KAG0785734.1 hypothetical protein G6F22_007862 [Rhizopus arrhizus]
MLPSTPSTLVDTIKTHGTFSVPKLSAPSPPPPTQAHIDIIRYSWEHLCNIRLAQDDPTMSPSYAFGLAFYDALFEIEPTLEFLFTNIVQQARAFAGMVSYFLRIPPTQNIREINALKRTPHLTFKELILSTYAFTDQSATDDDDLSYKLQELGARHYLYNLNINHLEKVSPALLKALRIRLGHEFLPEVEESWERSQLYVIHHMKIGLELAQSEWEQSQRELDQDKQGCIVQ